MDNDFQPARRPDRRDTAINTDPDDKTETFKTPEQAAADDETIVSNVATETETDPNTTMVRKPKSRWKQFNKLKWPPGKKEWISFIIILLLVSGGIFWWLHSKKPATLQPIPKVTDQSKTVPSKLTGLPVDPSINKRTVTGVMIENSPAARPQAGLGEAGVVFEAIAEGGITRFLALYQDTAPDNVGPVRSARPYYVQWNLGFDAGYAHVGGSPEALADIKAWHVRDLDQFYNSGAYHRISSRAAPHNVYTGIPALNKVEVEKGYETSSYTGFNRKSKATPNKSQPPAARSVNLALSGPAYNVHYDYDQAKNSYARSVGGAPQIDANTNQQISAAVVVAMVLPYSIAADGYHSNYGTLGSGQAFIFQDGGVTTGTWSKKDNTSQISFKDDQGKIIRLNPGHTWLSAVSGADKVTYSP